jgi:crotonobetainyl-CoA:carnitine CoA-transferase CaiB-like acyl-CoA transferase
MAGPLTGYTVVDAGWGMPTAVAGLLLADFGARVVKIERPGGGPDVASVTRAGWDRGKWSIELDLDTEQGRHDLTRLLGTADAFIESFGVGRAPTGLGIEEVAAAHPGLVHCSMTAYGPDGPWCDRPGYDALVAARFGATAEQLGHRDGPTFLGHPSIGYCSGLMATISVLAALRVRELTGLGQHVEASVLDGLLAQSPMNWWYNEGGLSYLARSGAEKGFGRTRLVTDVFRCGDGEYMMIHTGGSGSFKRAMDLLGVGERIRSVPGLEMAEPLDDTEYHIARKLVPEKFLDRPRADWLSLFQAADIAAQPVLRPTEVFEDEQIRHAGLIVTVDDPRFGPLQQVGPVARFEKSPADPPAPAPTVGQHNALLADLMARPAQPPRGRRALGQPLEGVRILDLSSFFATAYGARLLSDLGADVIKIEAPSGDQLRPAPDPFEACQRGKRNMCVDLRSSEGLRVVLELIRTADVVMHNLRPGKAERLGIGYEALKAVNPQLIYCYYPGFGASGPKAAMKSFAPLISGMCGLLYEGAGTGNPPIPRVMGNEDYYNGFLAATTTLMALLHRDRTGQAQSVELPQLHACLFAMSHHCRDAAGRHLPGLTLDRDQMGWSPLYRIYRTSDGAVCIACVGTAAFERLRAAFELDCGHDDAALATTLEGRFAEATEADAFALMEKHRVPCEVVAPEVFLPDFLWFPWPTDTDRVFEQHHDTYGYIREIGLLCHLSRTPGTNKGPAAHLGEHTRELLEELELPAGAIEELLASVCHQHTPADTR